MEYKILNKPGTKGRYIVVDSNGKLVDDAQGWGFKSKSGALASVKYKKSHPKHIEYKSYIGDIYIKYDKLQSIVDDVFEWVFDEVKNESKTPNNKHIENKILKRIRTEIPELWGEFEYDSELKYFFLKSL